MKRLATASSFLFVPGNDERKWARARTAGADAVIIDLEDGVAPAQKEDARALLKRSTAWAGPPLRLVRVNTRDQADFDAVAALELDAVVLPKSTAASVDAAGKCGHPVIALVETAMGFRDAYAIAEHPRVEGLMLGALDLSTELRLRRRDDGDELLYARSLLAFASAAAGIRAPIDGVPASLADTASQRCQASKARDLGFGGIACVHPQQIAAINEAFAPTPDELTWATRVVAAFESATAAGRGAVAVDDELVDRPVFLRAKTLLEIASKETI